MDWNERGPQLLGGNDKSSLLKQRSARVSELYNMQWKVDCSMVLSQDGILFFFWRPPRILRCGFSSSCSLNTKL